MIYFDLSANPSIIEEHVLGLKAYVLKQIAESAINTKIKDFLRNNLEDILQSKPDVLLLLHGELTDHKSYKSSLKPKIKKIFNYKYFTTKSNDRYDAYVLAGKLNIRTCLYCNRNYTLTVDKKTGVSGKITRPEFDHFFDQDDYPLLALSIYNLIPSCKTCNSTLKHTKKFTLPDYVHPYLDNCILYYNYEYLPYEVSAILGGSSNLGVQLKATGINTDIIKKIDNSSAVFKLNEIFSAHSEELKDLFDIRHRFSERYFQELVETYQRLDLEVDDIYRIIFGTYSQEADFSKRPFSKLKKDILMELDVI